MRAKAAVLLGAVLVCGVSAQATATESDARVAEARVLFERYVALEHAFDPAVADLYSDDAVIRNKRTYPTGQVKELTLPAVKYKELIRASMPLARARKDTSSYSDVEYTAEGEGVRITADRYSNLKEYHSPLSLLVKKSASGAWLIHEEISESQP